MPPITGPTGPTSPTGPTGPTGQTGPTGPVLVQVILTRDHASLLLAVLHHTIETGEGLDDVVKEEMRQLAVFFAAVTLEPQRFPVRQMSPTIKENKRRVGRARVGKRFSRQAAPVEEDVSNDELDRLAAEHGG